MKCFRHNQEKKMVSLINLDVDCEQCLNEEKKQQLCSLDDYINIDVLHESS